MAVFFSLTETNDSTFPTHDTRNPQHDSPYTGQRISSNIAQEESHFPSESDACPKGKDLPPRPESRMDFVPGPSHHETSQKTHSPSHTRTSSATLKWTREILKKIRLSTSSSDPVSTSIAGSSHSFCNELTPTAASTFDISTEAECATRDEALMSTDALNSSVSNSSLLTCSSDSWSALDNISVSLSTSSDGSCESDEDSDSDLDEIDLGEGLIADGLDVQYHASADRGKQACSISPLRAHHILGTASPSPVLIQSPATTSYSSPSSSSNADSISEKFPPVADLEEGAMDLVAEPRPKFEYFPSPLSQSQLSEPSVAPTSLRPPIQPERHLYAHRGHSRHALLYRKWFWALREEDWSRYLDWIEQYRSQQEAYTAMSVSPELPPPNSSQNGGKEALPKIQGWIGAAADKDLFPSLFSNARDKLPNNRRPGAETSGICEDAMPSGLPPLSIHPRWGDLDITCSYSRSSTYTDTWCLHTDRYLLVGMGLGLWTIRKVLWLTELRRISTARSHLENEEGEQTFVAEENEGLYIGSSSECHLANDDTESLCEEIGDDDLEEGQVMCSSVVSLTSLISTTGSFSNSDSDDSDVTLVESDSDSEPSSASMFAQTPCNAENSGRNVDFEKTCSSSYDSGDGDFEEVDLGCGSSNLNLATACSSSTAAALDSCSLEAESLKLYRTLYLPQHLEEPTTSACSSPSIQSKTTYSASSSSATSLKGKGARTLHELTKRSWYEQCELLLLLTSASST
ncbi:hypothetical protein BDP27DRAFT_31293 [Rhodocollybia butyracea]|uniref:Uncharacterized protein n=1 Tax=Rhodocollybia butyracea TaxID=206335 RepID=A0A9P5Q655_9AGAR|nr:hypothetical protein BDP27DRAFT_31293 [Rhodocollybia butyracea]